MWQRSYDGQREAYSDVTVPPGAKGFPVAVHRTEHAVQASWVIETDGSWTDYRDWVQPRLARQFDLVSAADGGLTFRRVASGDVFTLDVQWLTVNPALRVRFTLRGEAH